MKNISIDGMCDAILDIKEKISNEMCESTGIVKTLPPTEIEIQFLQVQIQTLLLCIIVVQ
jgi:hypothetical protein